MRHILFILLLAALSYTQTMPTDYIEWFQQGVNLTNTAGAFNTWTGKNGKILDNANGGTVDGDSLEYDGTDDYLGLSAQDTDFDPGTGDFSVFMQIKYSTALQAIMGQKRASGTSYAGWTAYKSTGGRFAIAFSDGTNSVYASSTYNSLVDNTVYVLGYVFDRTAGACSLYVDGSYVDQISISSVTGDVTALNAINHWFRTGETGDGTQDFNGTLLEFVLFSRVVTETEASTISTVLTSGEVTDEERGFKTYGGFKKY